VSDISLILRNSISITIEEFRILDRYSCSGRIWTLIHKPISASYISRQRAVEYIFDPEAFTIFRIVSCNVLATWDTDITRDLGPNDEFCITESLFIRPYL
jgi:hypothetical protein